VQLLVLQWSVQAAQEVRIECCAVLLQLLQLL
jgi:hypothetical protein